MYDQQTPTNEVIVCPVYVNMHELANLAANKTTDRAGATAVENKVCQPLEPLTLIIINLRSFFSWTSYLKNTKFDLLLFLSHMTLHVSAGA
jgi:hypothetical protein